MDPSDLCASLTKTMSPLFECTPAPREGVRVRTPMLYPDGGMVDVFVLERGDSHLLTDFGIELSRGQLTLRVGADDDMADAVIRLAQAVVRVSDISFTFPHLSPISTG